MLRYVLGRLLSLIPVLIGVAFIVFTLLYITPGDPARTVLGDLATEEMVAEFREQAGLNEPFLVQFGRYMGNLLQGDIGKSYITKTSVLSELVASFPYTLAISLSAILLAIVLGIPCGIISAAKQYSFFDSATMIFAMAGMSMPVFWLGLLLILTFSVHLHWLPSSGLDSFSALILPAFTLATPSLAIITRMTRSSMLEVLQQDYIKTARAKGARECSVIFRHGLRNALIPVITVAGVQFGVMLGGAVLTESIFSIPGIGRLMVNAINMRDYPVVQGGVLFIAFATCIVNLIVDVLYVYTDPRIKL